MRMKKRVHVAALALGIFAAGVYPDSPQWGPEEGNYELPSAVTYCGYKGMRPPTKDELLAACKAGVTKTWDKEGRPYITSTVTGPNRVAAIHSVSCEVTDVDAQFDSVALRCRSR